MKPLYEINNYGCINVTNCMKRNIAIYFILLFLPLVSIGQTWEEKLSEINQLTKQNDWATALSKTKTLQTETESTVGKDHINYAKVLTWLGYLHRYSTPNDLVAA